MERDSLFGSYFIGGFEGSSHRRRDGRRLDLVAGSGHEKHVLLDYDLLRQAGIRAVRESLRWHRIERLPGYYEWSSLLPMVRAAQASGMTVLWDLCHFGIPDGLDLFSGRFTERFAAFAGAAASVIGRESDEPPWYCVINEISFWSWAAAEVGYVHPGLRGRGQELKRQLVRASLAAMEAILTVDRRARFVQPEPAIHVVADAFRPQDLEAADRRRESQFEAWDMLSGRLHEELGGSVDRLDVLGVNFYWDNQWIHNGPTLSFGHPFYRPFSLMLQEIRARYDRPIVVTETGAEGIMGPPWLRHVVGEIMDARRAGVGVEGVCLYPVMDYPGWDDDRHCPCGLIEVAGAERRLRPEMQRQLDECRDTLSLTAGRSS